MANLVYNSFKKAVMLGTFNLESYPVYCALVSNSYTPDGDTHVYHSSLTNVVTPSNYTASFALSAPVVSTNNTTNEGVFDAPDALMANVTFSTTVRAAVLFGSSGGGSALDPLIAYVDFGSDQSVTAGTFQIQWASGGILALT